MRTILSTINIKTTHMTYTDSNKNSIYKWRKQNQQAWSVLHKQHSKTYYEKTLVKKESME